MNPVNEMCGLKARYLRWYELSGQRRAVTRDDFFLAADKGREKRDGSTLGDRLNYWDVKMSIQYDFMLK
ncbi:putative outer membrane porin protein [Escherichia coli]|nr:putative outer membrane porin protein [Escherichia coli]